VNKNLVTHSSNSVTTQQGFFGSFVKNKKMKTLKFKTNINCSGCVRAVTPFLSNTAGVSSWKVDTENPEKVLTAEGEALDADQVKKAVEKAGFTSVQI
jgi:copper chaperone CopZ